jgi:hypothetical protein
VQHVSQVKQHPDRPINENVNARPGFDGLCTREGLLLNNADARPLKTGEGHHGVKTTSRGMEVYVL